MKTKTVTTVLLLSVLAASGLFAGPADKPSKGSAEFEHMKSLVGTWKGKADMGEGPREFTVEYKLVAGAGFRHSVSKLLPL